jgi:xanthine dehydrogenase accessory factor
MKRDLLDRLLAARAAKRPAALVTELAGGAQALVEDGVAAGELTLSADEMAVIDRAIRDDRSGLDPAGARFVQVFNPPLRLIVIGAVHIAQELVPLATIAGYDVTLVDPRRAWASTDRFPEVSLLSDWPDDALSALAPDHRTAVVALTHDPKLDDPALRVGLESEAFYIGALGSTRTHAKRLDRLREAGLGDAQLARIHGPIGLAIGAKSPAEIAIAILAQMTQVLRGAPALVRAEASS